MQVTLTKRKSAAPQAPVPWAKALSHFAEQMQQSMCISWKQTLHPMYSNTLAARSMSGGANVSCLIGLCPAINCTGSQGFIHLSPHTVYGGKWQTPSESMLGGYKKRKCLGTHWHAAIISPWSQSCHMAMPGN